jgi:GMP synthase (glutamine-hydrolysing)
VTPERAAAPPVDPADEFDTCLVVDFGAQYAQLIARRVREAHVYSEIVPHSITAAEVRARRPAALILSGGPKSVHVEGAPALDPEIYELGVPILGICYGAQLLAQQLGGEVARGGKGEYGRTTVRLLDAGETFDAVETVDGSPGDGSASADPESVGSASADGEGALPRLLADQPLEQTVWMSHFDGIARVPEGFVATATSADAPVAALESPSRRMWGVQYHPEVSHTPYGQQVLRQFLHHLAGCRPTWTMTSIIEQQVAAIQAQVGGDRVICALSGGVDSAVAAALVHKAVGPQLTCVFVDTGLLRQGEGEQVVETFRRHQHIELIHVRAAERYFEGLAGVTDPEDKRKIVGELFIRIFEESAGGLVDARFLVQGTLYPDVIESGGGDGASTIKSHHNVGGLPEDMTFELVEPLRSLFKDEVRRVGEELGLPEEIVWRQPFPGPGLAVRIIGEVTPDKVAMLQHADAIVREELRKAGLEREIWQSFAVLPDIRSVGVMGDERTYAHPVIIRAVTSEDAMTADWARLPYDVMETMSSRIINEVAGVNRVAYDITSKPPGTIEWE